MAGGARGRGCKAAATEAGTLRPGPEPQPHSQRTRHAPATAEATMGAAQAALRDAPQTRGLAHEARRRTRQVAGGLAPGRYRACCAGRRVRLRAQSPEAPRSAPARGSLSAAYQSVWARPGPLVAVLHPVGRDRGGLQESQGRPRPATHLQLEQRIEAHIAFIAYCLHVTLRARLKPLAGGLTPRAVLDKLAAVQMLDVHFPTTDGRILILSRYTELNADQKLLINQLRLTLPPQPPPRITAAGQLASAKCSGDLLAQKPNLSAFRLPLPLQLRKSG